MNVVLQMLVAFLHGQLSSAAQLGTAAKATIQQGPQSFLSGLQFQYKLRICNVYPSLDKIDVFTSDGAKKLNAAPMAYRTCEEFKYPVQAGDRLDFNVGEVEAGTFDIEELPQSDATLLVVVSRRDTSSAAVAFKSHVFASVREPQVAVFDTYRGQRDSEIRIHHQDLSLKTNLSQSELLRADSVVTVRPGVYFVGLLKDSDASRSASARTDVELEAVPQETYVVIRCGVDDAEGQDYSEELMVYPSAEEEEAHHSGARMRQLSFNGLFSSALFVTMALSV